MSYWGKTLALFSFLYLFTLSVPAAAKFCQPNDRAEVKWQGSWYPVTVVKAQKNRCYVHYDGYDDAWNEWVGPNRIRGLTPGTTPLKTSPETAVVAAIRPGSPVSVLWKGKYWPAHVLKVNGDQLYIHYDGYGSEWNEWVGPDRYK